MEEKKEKEDLRTDRKLFLHLKSNDEYLNQKKTQYITKGNIHHVLTDSICVFMLLSIRIGSNEINWVKYGSVHMMFIFFPVN
jgi:hypothetical protein